MDRPVKPNVVTCPRGHEWQLPESADGEPSPLTPICPVCAAPLDPPSSSQGPSDAGVSSSVHGKQDPESPPKAHSEEVPGYDVLGVLGHGGMGVVFRARHIKLKRLVALKMILSGRHAGAEHLARFHSEAQAVARLQHPNIVQIYEVGEHEGLPWISLEYVEGGTLAQHLAGNPQPPRQAAQVLETLARAVHYAHQHGIVHRDLKPANVLLQESGDRSQESGGKTKSPRPPDSCLLTPDSFSPKITDFGLAKHLEDDCLQTKSGVIIGTPSYMPPEQAEGKSRTVGPATDVYSLGAILYEMLTGRPPFKAASLLDTVQLVLMQEPVAPRRLQPKVEADLETICLKCLQKDPLKRYASAEALAEDLRRFQANEAILARPAGLAERLLKWARRRPALAGLVAVSALATLVLLAGWFAFTLKIRREYRRAEAHLQTALQVVNQMVETASDKAFQDEPRLQEKSEVMLKTAQRLFEGFLKEKSDDPEVRQKAALAQQKVAYLYVLLNEPQKAAQAYQDAIALLTQFEGPTPELRHALAECHNWRGEVLRSTGQLEAAQQAYEETRRLLEALVHEFPEELTYRKDWARSHYNSGLVFKERGQPQEAEKKFRAAIALLEKPLPAGTNKQVTAEMRKEEATSYLNLATVLTDPQAVAAYTKAISILADLAGNQPEVPDYRFELALAHNNRAIRWARLSRGPPQNSELLQKADNDRRQAVILLEKLSKDYPRRPKFSHELANSLNSRGLAARANRKEARAAWNQATTILERLVADYPKTTMYQRDLGMTLGNLGWLFGQENQWPEARLHLQRAIAQVEAALGPNPENRVYRQALRNKYHDLIQALCHLHDHAGAVQAAADLTRTNPQNKEDYYLAAKYLAKCLDLAEKDQELTAEKRKQCCSLYAQEAVKLLGQARDRGWTNFEPIFTDPAFEPLARHPAFDKLRKELPR